MNIKLREAEKQDEMQVIEMYKEYINSELVPGIDTFEGIRDFEKLENLTVLKLEPALVGTNET